MCGDCCFSRSWRRCTNPARHAMTIPMAPRMQLRVLLIDANERVFDTFVALAKFSNPSWDIRRAPNHEVYCQ